jgi:acyl-CoA reductase-like NAD-dependent aldehyde dehydrogenase
MAARQYQLFIDGQFTPSESGQTIIRNDPATGLPLSEYAAGTAHDVNRAVAAARRAFDEGDWPRMPPQERSRILYRMAQGIRAEKALLAQLESAETGKPIVNAEGDIEGTADMIEYCAGLARDLRGDAIDMGKDLYAINMREPIGVVGMIVPWNFPLAILCQKLPWALASGCTAVAKPSELTSATALEAARIFKEAGLPDGVYNVVTGYGETAGAALCAHTDVDMLTFTGSTEVGRKVLQAAASNMKKVVLELGGKSPNIVFADADLDEAVEASLFAVFYMSGQCCLAGSRLLVQSSIYDTFVEKLAARAQELRLGLPSDRTTQLGPLVSQEQFHRVARCTDMALKEGARLVIGGARVTTPPFENGYFYPPTIFADVSPQMQIAHEEVFGPVLVATRFEDAAEAARIANATAYGLGAGVWTQDIDTAMKMARAIRAGTVWVNTYLSVRSELPFGGTRMSGHGRELGRAGIEEFTIVKNVQFHLGPRQGFFSA